MAYQALYRTFRPETFGDIVGQEAITTTLKNQLREGRAAHAYLFCGSRGTGKTTTARVLARAVNCLEPIDGCEPCGHCVNCQDIAAERSMDVVEIDAASNNGVDEIRDLRDKIKYPPSSAKRKVYIIDEVHMLSTGAFNALLKTLEEPPAHAMLLLATTEPNKLPATILSRCQRFDFKRYSAAVIAGQLKKIVGQIGAQAEDEALSDIARAAEGGMRDALSLLDTCLSYGDGNVTVQAVSEAAGVAGRACLFAFAEALLADDAAGALTRIDELMRDGRDPIAFSREATGHIRALLVAKAVGNAPEDVAELLDCTGEDAKRYIEQSKKGSEEKLLRAMEGFMRCESDMKWSSQPRSALELCAFLCCRPEEQLRLDALAERVDKLERALKEGVVAKPRAAKAEPGDSQSEAPRASAAGAKAAPAKSAPAKAGPAQGADKWAAAVKELGEANKALLGPLSKMEYAGREGGEVVLEYEKNATIYATVINRDDKKAALGEALTKAFGEPTTVTLRPKGGTKKDADPERTDAIRHARDIFGRENVDFLD